MAIFLRETFLNEPFVRLLKDVTDEQHQIEIKKKSQKKPPKGKKNTNDKRKSYTLRSKVTSKKTSNYNLRSGCFN